MSKTKTTTTTTTTEPKADVYSIITDKIIAKLEAGVIPWRKPWRTAAPCNAVSKRPYNGVNFFVLSVSEYNDPRWLTFKQAIDLGGNVKKGERGTPVVFWKIMRKDAEEEGGKARSIPLLRFYTVFNVEQCEGLKIPTLEEYLKLSEVGAHVGADEIVEGMPMRPPIRHGGNRAFYAPSLDSVTMPPRERFDSMEAYYSTLFHELTHSTGHESRLNRKGITEAINFGSENYAQEELIAELGAAYLCAAAGVDNTLQSDANAAYIANWLNALKNDKRMVIYAAGSAQKAADFILGKCKEVEEEDKEEQAA